MPKSDGLYITLAMLSSRATSLSMASETESRSTPDLGVPLSSILPSCL